MLTFFVLGAGIGLVAGVSPGPVLTLVVAETLKGGWLRGAAVAAGPLLADGPIILLAVGVLAQLPPGLVPAISVIGAISSPSPRRYSSGATPRCARRATSHTANVSQAWKTSCATSAGWKGASKGNGFRSGSRKLHSGRWPSFFSRRRVSSASAPVITATSQSPRNTAAAAPCTSTWGVVPPMPE